MADLFDFKVGGLGFHITAHMIAIAALFVACFAITGYITFRDDSIDTDALKHLTVVERNGIFYEKAYDVTLTASAVQTAVGNDDVLFATPLVSDLPAGTEVVTARMDVLNALVADPAVEIAHAATGTAADAATVANLTGTLGDASTVSSSLATVSGNGVVTTAAAPTLFIAAGAAGGGNSALAVGDSIRVRFVLRSISPL